jgi:isoquinoline 1-oxidoreductase beta subunit
MFIDYVDYQDLGVPAGTWRGVGVTHNVFVVESFVDELALSAGRDPVDYRRALMSKNARALGVLNLAVEKAGWGGALPPRSGRGVSVLSAFRSHMAQVAQVAVRKDGQVRVERVTCAIDCGRYVNPDTIVAQIHSGIIFGLSAALYEEITLVDGRVEQSNFDTFRVMRIDEAPAIDVHIVKSDEAPGGIGETATAGIFPAVANAVFAATKVRFRKLPLAEDALKSA